MENENWSSIDILKMDIEGSEKEVFSSNYAYWLPRTRCIIIEIHDFMRAGSSNAVFATMAKYNFSLAVHDENLIFMRVD